MKNNLVSLIKKIAEEFDDIPLPNPGESVIPGKGTRSSRRRSGMPTESADSPKPSSSTPSKSKKLSRFQYEKIQEVEDMQNSIITFCKQVSSSPQAIINFLNDNFIKNIEEEYKVNKQFVKLKQKSISNPNQNLLLDNIRSMGQQASHLTVDGKWGPQTDDALTNIKSFTNVFLKTLREMNLDRNEKNKNDIDKLNSFLSNLNYGDYKSMDNEKKKEIGKYFNESINLLTQIFQSFSSYASTNLRSYIMDNQPLDTYLKGEEILISDDENKIISSGKTINIPNEKKEFSNLPLAALKDKNSIIQYLINLSAQVDPNNKLTERTAIEYFNKNIKPKIEGLS